MGHLGVLVRKIGKLCVCVISDPGSKSSVSADQPYDRMELQPPGRGCSGVFS